MQSQPKCWTFVAILKSEQDPSISVQSVQSIGLDNSPFVWSPSGLALEDYDLKGNQLVFEFVLKCDFGQMLATKVEIPTEYFEYKESDRQLQKDKVSIVYSAHQSYDKKVKKTYGSIYIKKLALTNFDVTPLVGDQTSGHKITCMINDTYLGRAQSCHTTPDQCRTYTWSQGSPTDGFEGMSPRGNQDKETLQEHASDLSLIRMADPSGTHRRNSTIQQKYYYIPDNDSYTNEQNRLPLYLSDTNALRIYNFKFTPPKCIECKLKLNQFVVSGALSDRATTTVRPFALFRRKNSEIPPIRMGLVEYLPFDDRRMVVELMFSKEDDKIRIVRVAVKVEDYDTTLSMNCVQKLVSL